MRVGVNYSAVAERLLRGGQIEAEVFKCPEWPDLLARVTPLRPCYPHFAFRAGRGDVFRADWERVRGMMAGSALGHINMHLAPNAADFPGLAMESRAREDEERLVAAMTRDVRRVQQELPGRAVALEGVMWDPLPPWQIPLAALDARVIRRVVLETDAALLLDLAHAAISAERFGRDTREYIGDLPLERLLELHVSGTALGEDGLWRDHFPMRDEDWALARWALERIGGGEWPAPEVVTLEYGGIGAGYDAHGDEEVLRRDLGRLCEGVRAVRGRRAAGAR